MNYKEAEVGRMMAGRLKNVQVLLVGGIGRGNYKPVKCERAVSFSKHLCTNALTDSFEADKKYPRKVFGYLKFKTGSVWI